MDADAQEGVVGTLTRRIGNVPGKPLRRVMRQKPDFDGMRTRPSTFFSTLPRCSVRFDIVQDLNIKSARFNMQDALFLFMGNSMPKTMDSCTITRWWRITPAALVILALAVCLIAVPAAAHSPAGMDISFDPNTAKISVTITHQVDDPATHYLSRVKVKLNGNVISDPDYKSQPAKDTFTLTYDVNAAAGDEVWVTTTCVRGGVLEKTYKVPQPVRPVTSAQVPSTYQAQPPAAVPPTTKAPAGFLPLLGALAAVFLIRKI